MEDEDLRAPISRLRLFITFLVLLTVSWAASTLAGTITLNSNNRIEFGQGVYNLKACDSFVGINLRSGSGANLDKVRFLDLSGFDKTKCKNKFFTIKLQQNGNDLNLINFGSAIPNSCGVTNLSNATVSIYGGKCVIKFTNNGSATLPTGLSSIDYLVVGGGGAGGFSRGGGGGAGAFVLANDYSINSRSISVTIGAGGSGISSSNSAGNDGESSTLTLNGGTVITANGGGGGGTHKALNSSGVAPEPGRSGGSGGGASINYSTYRSSGGAALDAAYGNAGGRSSSTSDSSRYTGGGGGAGGVGLDGSSTQKPNGGAGKLDLLGNYIAAGGGGADGRGNTGSSPFCETSYSSSGAGDGGSSGVGGRGELSCDNISGQSPRTATSGATNTGSGGGGAIGNISGAGGSGVVQISFTPTSSISTTNKVVLRVSNDVNPSVYLVYTYGVEPGSDIGPSGDSYQVLSYSTGVYTIEFLNPLVLVSEVTGTTFESSSTYS